MGARKRSGHTAAKRATSSGEDRIRDGVTEARGDTAEGDDIADGVSDTRGDQDDSAMAEGVTDTLDRGENQ